MALRLMALTMAVLIATDDPVSWHQWIVVALLLPFIIFGFAAWRFVCVVNEYGEPNPDQWHWIKTGQWPDESEDDTP